MFARRLTALSIYFLFGCAEGTLAIVNADETHTWSTISYPRVSCEFGSGTALPSLAAVDLPDWKGLGFGLSFWWPKAAEQEEGFAAPDGNKIRLRLHHADGRVVTPSQSNFTKPFARSSHTGRNWHGAFSCVFPWDKNEMQEAWLELAFPDRTYWLEIPYGITRDPGSSELPTSKSGRPKLAPAMKTLPQNAQIVNWKDVFYQMGEVKDDFWASLQQSNPLDAHSRVVLMREVATLRWSLDSPRVSVSIRDRSGATLKGHAKGNRLSESDSFRTDDFDFNRNSGDEDTRDWGTIVVTVGNRQWKTMIPSSLYRHAHGVADPDHKATLR